MTADEEEGMTIAQANSPIDAEGYFTNEHVACRRGHDVLEVTPDKVDYMDVSPKEVVSIGTAMIPFLENDDANRALMGANMQRQAVPFCVPKLLLSVPVWNIQQLRLWCLRIG